MKRRAPSRVAFPLEQRPKPKRNRGVICKVTWGRAEGQEGSQDGWMQRKDVPRNRMT